MTRIFFVKVKFSSIEHIHVDESNGEINITINELPIRARAIKAIIKALSKYFNTKPENVKIVQGLSSKIKTVAIT
jgi:uncharacterized protein